LGKLLVEVASASIDVSDGLIADLNHVAKTSDVQIAIEAARVPVSRALKRSWHGAGEGLIRAVTAGDDYEIAFTAPAENRKAIAKASAASQIPVSEIGRVHRGKGIVLMDDGGREISVPQSGFTHF
jgi:thiamine-monophosphate kinase